DARRDAELCGDGLHGGDVPVAGQFGCDRRRYEQVGGPGVRLVLWGGVLPVQVEVLVAVEEDVGELVEEREPELVIGPPEQRKLDDRVAVDPASGAVQAEAGNGWDEAEQHPDLVELCDR